jgi:transcriptional regulator with XRE-family HTH domain
VQRQPEARANKERPTGFGKWMTARRLARGWGEQELAQFIAARTGRRCNIGRVSNWEQGKEVPAPDQLQALKEIFGEEPPEPQLIPKPLEVSGQLRLL